MLTLLSAAGTMHQILARIMRSPVCLIRVDLPVRKMRSESQSIKVGLAV